MMIIAFLLTVFFQPVAEAHVGHPAPDAAEMLITAGVFINGVPVASAELASLGSVPAGRYWYDATSGAWGMEGGPTQGFLQPGLTVGGPLATDVSLGTTGVFVNGRQLPSADLQALSQVAGRTLSPGQYVLDAHGSLLDEAGSLVVNIRQGAGAAAAPAPAPAAQSTPVTGEQHFPSWNIRYSVPSGWRMAGQEQNIQTLSDTTGGSVMYVVRLPASSQQEVERLLGQLFHRHQSSAQVVAPFSPVTGATGQVLSGQIASGPYQGQVTARIGRDGTSLVAVGIGTGAGFAGVQAATDQLVLGSQLGAPQPNTAVMQQLVGTFSQYAGNSSTGVDGGGWAHSSETFVTFRADGSFHTNTNSMVSASSASSSELNSWAPQGSASDIGETAGAGRWVVYDDLLVLKTSGGLQVMSIEVYSNGLKADGQLWERR